MFAQGPHAQTYPCQLARGILKHSMQTRRWSIFDDRQRIPRFGGSPFQDPVRVLEVRSESHTGNRLTNKTCPFFQSQTTKHDMSPASSDVVSTASLALVINTEEM